MSVRHITALLFCHMNIPLNIQQRVFYHYCRRHLRSAPDVRRSCNRRSQVM